MVDKAIKGKGQEKRKKKTEGISENIINQPKVLTHTVITQLKTRPLQGERRKVKNSLPSVTR